MDAIEFDRSFQIWAYTVSHGQLLLRSPKGDENDTRIDVSFRDVAAVRLPTVMDGLRIERVSAEQAGLQADDLGTLSIGARAIYAIRGVNYRGYVVAGSLVTNEDDGEYFEASQIYPA